MVQYEHGEGGVTFKQFAKDPLPKWATNVRPYFEEATQPAERAAEPRVIRDANGEMVGIARRSCEPANAHLSAERAAEQDKTKELLSWLRWFLNNVNDPDDFRWVRMREAADMIESLAAEKDTNNKE